MTLSAPAARQLARLPDTAAETRTQNVPLGDCEPREPGGIDEENIVLLVSTLLMFLKARGQSLVRFLQLIQRGVHLGLHLLPGFPSFLLQLLILTRRRLVL